MMNKNRSAKGQILKFLFLLPLLAVVLLAFRQVATSQIKNFDVFPQVTVQTTDTVPQKPPPPPQPKQFDPPKVIVKIDSTKTNITVTFKDGTVRTFDLNNPKEKAEFRKKYRNVSPPPPPPPPKPSDNMIPPKPSDDMIMIDASEHVKISADSFVFRDKLSLDEMGDLKWKVKREKVGEPIYLLDGKRINLQKLKYVLSKDIKEIQVYKNEAAIHLYGPDAVHGVIDVRTKAEVRNEIRVVIDSIWLKNHVGGDKANVLYIGIDNPINVEVEDVDPANVIVEATSPAIAEKKANKWIIKVGNIEENIEIRIYQKHSDGKMKLINSRYFRSRLLPDPKKSADNI